MADQESTAPDLHGAAPSATEEPADSVSVGATKKPRRRRKPSEEVLARKVKKLENERVKTQRIPKKLDIDGKIEHLVQHAVDMADRQIDPFVDIPMRTLSNVNFSQRKRIIEMGDATQRRSLFNMNQARKFMQTFVIARGCQQLQAEGKTTSIRDLYYMSKHTLGKSDENTFDDQVESDPIIEDLEVTLGALREELHLFAAKRGSAVGPMTLIDAGDEIDLSRMGSGGWSVPGIVEPETIRFIGHEAEFILLVEKEAVWARLNEDKFWKRHKCILVTGQGQPPRGVRRLLHRMVKELDLPLYVFVDNDPWGYYIHSVVKQGSINLAFESQRMAIPSAQFIGLSAYDPVKFGISPSVSIKLNEQDRSRAKELLAYEWFQDRKWQREIKHMLREGVKWELEALSNKGLSFVTEEYLPEKIRSGDVI
jgi:DNA topoisomerase-6 subunit A